MLPGFFHRMSGKRSAEGKGRGRCRLSFEALEDRSLLATFTVNSLSGGNTSGTLRWAIQQANATAAFDTVEFDPMIQGGTIALEGSLPTISTEMEIDGTTHPAYQPGTPAFTINGATLDPLPMASAFIS
jgi:hypothetical protein